jgi:hypothetical protein
VGIVVFLFFKEGELLCQVDRGNAAGGAPAATTQQSAVTKSQKTYHQI